MIRILQVVTIMNRGGAETMVMNYYRQMDRSKVQFDFLVHRPERGAYEDEIEQLGGHIYRIPPVYDILSHRRAIKQFFEEHPDYQVIHGHVGELGYYLYKEASRRHIPCIIAHAHNASCDHDWKWPLRQVLKHLVRPYVTTPMTCGKDAAQWLFGKELVAKAVMLNNAIDAARYRFSPETRERVRTAMGWNGCYVIGDVARFSPQKNHIFLIRLFAQVAQQRQNARLALIGSTTGDLFNKVQALVHELGIADKVEFLGARDDVAELMQGMDVYCFPSLYEGFGIAMLEAEAAGLMTVKSDNVPDDAVVIPELVKTCPLSAPWQTWIDALLAPYDRQDTYRDICRAGFDIRENAHWLQEFYLKQTHSKP